MFLSIMHDLRFLSQFRKLAPVDVNGIILRTQFLCEDTQNRRKPRGGGRSLKDWNDVFKYNSWDNVVWDDTQEAAAKSKVEENSEVTKTSEEIEKLDIEAASHWDAFYDIHQNRFFKDRNWLFTEFPELAKSCCESSSAGTSTSESDTSDSGKSQGVELSSSDNSKSDLMNVSSEEYSNESYPGERARFRIFEVGCGVGNTIFPILKTNNSDDLFVYGCDFSSQAIDIVKGSEEYDKRRCFAFVSDIASEEWNTPFPEDSLDLIVCIFVLSAVHPNKFRLIAEKMASLLKPGGMVLFRDYGRYDLAQLRFKKGQCLSENFYARGDGTRCYFFTQDEIRQLMTSAGLVEVQNIVDRRLQVNRGKRITMYRVWVQAKYHKPL